MITWIDEEIHTNNQPPNTKAGLIGNYDDQTNHVFVWIYVTLRGTKYRVLILHKPVNPKNATPEQLHSLFRNSTSYYLSKFSNGTWGHFIHKFLKWNKNPVVRKVLSVYLPNSPYE